MRLIGHRGARGEAPENTLGGFEYIKNLGLLAVEFDIRQTLNGDLVVIHDNNLTRTAQSRLNVEELTHTTRHQVDQRGMQWQHWPRFEKTPLLTETLELLSHFTHIEIEVKPLADSAAIQRLIDTLLPILDGLQNRVVITSFDAQFLAALQHQNQFKTGLLIEFEQIMLNPAFLLQQTTRTSLNYDAIVGYAQQLKCTQLGLQDGLCTQEFMLAVKKAQLSCSVWTVNNTERALLLKHWGIDGLITDYPAQMLAAGLTV